MVDGQNYTRWRYGYKIKIADILRKLLNQYNLFYPPKIQIQFSQGIIYDQQNRFAH